MRYVACTLFLMCALTSSIVRGQESAQREIVLDFEGSKNFSRQQLLDVADKCLAERHQRRDEYDSSALDYCLRKVKLFLVDRGYLRAVVGQPRRQITERELKVVVPVDEGVLYHLGEVTIKGSKLFSPEQLLEMFSLKAGDVAAGEAISTWLDQKVKCAYADNGYIQFDFNIEPVFKPIAEGESEGVVDFKIDISEGQRFTIRRIIFVGNKHTSDQTLRRALLIREGDPFSQSLYDDSIRNLNQLGLFEEIDGSRDVKWRTVDRSAQFDVIVHLKEKPRT